MLPDKAKFVECSIIGQALSFWMKHLLIGQLQKPAKFSAFHWSPSRRQAFIGQLSGTNRVVHLPKRTVMVLFTISDRNGPICLRPLRRLCGYWVQHGSTTTCISYPQCSLTFMRERYLHRSFAYAKSAVGIDVVSVHKLFAYRVVSTVSTDIVSSHTKYCRIAYGITR